MPYKKIMNSKYMSAFLSLLVCTVLSGIIIALMGENPFAVYAQLFKSAFVGNFNLGTTIEKFVPLLLTGLAFIVSSRVGVFNVGVEGELYLGAITAAFVGYTFKGLPSPIHIILCIFSAMLVGSLWAFIPGFLKAYYKVNEVCVTILMNYVAIHITSYLVSGPLSGKTGISQTKPIEKSAALLKILKPSRANTGIFIAVIVCILVYYLLKKTKLGFQIRSTGMNPFFSEYVGIQSKKIMVTGMMLSGAIGGLAGAIEVMGIYGVFLDNFSSNIAFDGMLAALIAKGSIGALPFLSLFIAALKSGSLGLERNTGIPKSLIDVIIALFILLVTMEKLFEFSKKRKKGKEV
ncbi:MAG: ABC transporter permease [Leptotrichiaceae bacterium]|nr:ABC transporter permease [Leptotrichiaceae bacterium]